MSRHSKNNNASSVFTYAERQMLRYGTQEARVGRDSLRDFDACFLCLEKLRDPVSCLEGHFACRECFLENVLAQRREIERMKRNLAVAEDQQTQADLQKQNDAKLVEIERFEKTQDGLLPSDLRTAVASEKNAENSFWIPKNAPTSKNSLPTLSKTGVTCPIGDHPLHVKKLISVKFVSETTKGSKDKTSFICPACKKQLTNSVSLVLVKTCGHVVCRVCTEKFMKASGHCFVCEGKCKDKDLINVQCDGTGYASKGGVEIKKYDVAFKA